MKARGLHYALWGAVVLALAVGVGVSVNAGRADEDAPAWEASFDQAAARARQDGKLLMVDFMATWCGPCRMLDRTTYRDPAVRQAMARLVCVKVDVDRNPALSRRFQVSALPSIIFFTSDGKPLMGVRGYREPEEMLAAIQEAVGLASSHAKNR